MYQRTFLGLEEARKAVDAILEEARKNEPYYPISVAVVDISGHLSYFAKLDGSFPVQVRLAINKAHTAAIMRRATGAVGEFKRKYNYDTGTFGDEKFTDIAGGICITTKDGTPLAGIGVSGIPLPEGDEELVVAGPKALDLPYR